MDDDLLLELLKRSMKALISHPDIPLEELLFSAIGPEQVQTVEELNAAGENMVFACVRVADALPEMVVSGSVHKTCGRCEATVWMSPGTCMTYDRLEKKEIVCVSCLNHYLESLPK